jgi:hypothetical protein
VLLKRILHVYLLSFCTLLGFFDPTTPEGITSSAFLANVYYIRIKNTFTFSKSFNPALALHC